MMIFRLVLDHADAKVQKGSHRTVDRSTPTMTACRLLDCSKKRGAVVGVPKNRKPAKLSV